MNVDDLTDEKLDEWEYNARRVCGEHGERVDTICDGIDVMARTIREQRAEIERLRGALPAEEEWKRRAAQALSGHDMRVADEEKTDDQ